MQSQRPAPSNFVKWTVCIIAAIGFAFDIYELLMLPLILRPALQELIGAAPGTAEFEYWRGVLFFVPAMAGGIFGLLGGYLTDLWGRRSVLTFSILLYAFSALASGFVISRLSGAFPLYHVHRRVHRICRSRCLAGGIVS